MEKRYCVGIDLGGTSIKFGLLDQAGEPGRAGTTLDLPTPQAGADAVLQQMVDGARQLMAKNGLSNGDVAAIGVGSPGPLKMSLGIIIETPNIPGMTNVPVVATIQKALHLPTVLENDANAAGFGEYVVLQKTGIRNMVFLTLGTGVGGGIVVDGKVVRGAHEIGAELGHMIVQPGGEPCNCGQCGCLERYSSATFLSQRAQRMIEGGAASSLRAVLERQGTLNSKDINQARKAGDAVAAKVWDDAAMYLGVACVNMARSLDPDLIVLGGGMAKAGDDILLPVREHFHRMTWKITRNETDIVLAKLGNDAGYIGAAGVAWQAFREGALGSFPTA